MLRPIRLVSLLLALLLALPLLLACRNESFEDTITVDPDTIASPCHFAPLSTQGEERSFSASFALLDRHERGVENTEVKVTLPNGEVLFATTDGAGQVTLDCALAAGTHVLTLSFAGNGLFAPATYSWSVTVPPLTNRSAVYVRAQEMDAVDFEALEALHVGHVFLHQGVMNRKSNAAIEAFIAEAAEHGVRVHLWMICLWDGGELVSPIVQKEDGKGYPQDYFNAEAEKMKKAAALKGLYGLHFDYIRFDGENNPASQYKKKDGSGNGEDAITEFVRQMVLSARAVNQNLVFSGAVMAEYGDLVPLYGQDLVDLDEYLDFVVPMLYAGNYGEDTDWVAECARKFAEETEELSLTVWAGLLTYRSDRDQTVKTEEEMREETEAALDAGADGIAFFYYDGRYANLIDLYA